MDTAVPPKVPRSETQKPDAVRSMIAWLHDTDALVIGTSTLLPSSAGLPMTNLDFGRWPSTPLHASTKVSDAELPLRVLLSSTMYGPLISLRISCATKPWSWAPTGSFWYSARQTQQRWVLEETRVTCGLAASTCSSHQRERQSAWQYFMDPLQAHGLRSGLSAEWDPS